jgi:hypothetical protein
VRILSRVATQHANEQQAKQASDIFVSLFTIYLSGTHAKIEQRLGVIEEHLKSSEAKARKLGLAALDQMLEMAHFSSHYQFEFGARSRDYGYQPRSAAERTQWYGATLALIERLVLVEGIAKPELRDLLAQNFRFRGLWTLAQMYDELERLAHRFADDGFWREGWVACQQTMQLDRGQLTPEAASRLSALEVYLRPSNLYERVQAVVLGDKPGKLSLEDIDTEGDPVSTLQRLSEIARELGVAVAVNDEVFTKLVPDLLRGGNQVWGFGRGLASGSPDLRVTWERLVEGLGQLVPEQRDVQVLRGFLVELWGRDRDLAQDLLDSAIDQPALVALLPFLNSAVELDEQGVQRLKRALSTGLVPVRMYGALKYGRTIDHLAGATLKDLLMLIADQADGFDVAVEILSMRLHLDRSAQRSHEPEILEAGRELLQCAIFRMGNQSKDYELSNIAKLCLNGPESGKTTKKVAMRLKQAVSDYKTNSFDNDRLLSVLLELQPIVTLDALFAGDDKDGIEMFSSLSDHRHNPADIIACDALITWCEADRERRYPLAASIITLMRRSEESYPKIWSEQAKVLIAQAPDPRTVLGVFIERFRPMSWRGSRATVMEENAQLLDNLEPYISSDMIPFVTEAKAQFAQQIAQVRQQETERDRGRDERFEW